MKRNEFASEYLRQYENTNVIITAVTHFGGATPDSFLAQYEECEAFDLSDGTHWFSDDTGTFQVGNSLTDMEITWNDTDGWVILNEDGTTFKIEWL